MNKKFILALLATMLTSYFAIAAAYDITDLNRRLRSCTPTKDYNAGGSTYYQITGLTGSTCIFKILYNSPNKSDIICKVPYEKMPLLTSFNPISSQRVKNQYCVMSIKSLNGVKRTY